MSRKRKRNADDLSQEAKCVLESISASAATESAKAMKEWVHDHKDSEKILHLLEFIREEALIIIHVPDDVLCLLAKDTYYRNQFETGQTRGQFGQPRLIWEHNMFEGKYDKASAFDRCKYGRLLVINNPKDLSLCSPYGTNYLELKSTIRPRITCCYGDSGCGAGKQKMGTLDHFAHLLRATSKEDLEILFERETTCDHLCWYFEIQIHGSINLSRDVARLVLHPDVKISAAEEAIWQKRGIPIDRNPFLRSPHDI